MAASRSMTPQPIDAVRTRDTIPAPPPPLHLVSADDTQEDLVPSFTELDLFAMGASSVDLSTPEAFDVTDLLVTRE